MCFHIVFLAQRLPMLLQIPQRICTPFRLLQDNPSLYGFCYQYRHTTSPRKSKAMLTYCSCLPPHITFHYEPWFSNIRPTDLLTMGQGTNNLNPVSTAPNVSPCSVKKILDEACAYTVLSSYTKTRSIMSSQGFPLGVTLGT